jgi:hypothetical protein
MAELLNTTVDTRFAVMTLKDGSRMTTELNILRTGAFAILNISNAMTLKFANDEELDKYLAKKFEMFKDDKEMYQTFTGMDDETWEEWNK